MTKFWQPRTVCLLLFLSGQSKNFIHPMRLIPPILCLILFSGCAFRQIFKKEKFEKEEVEGTQKYAPNDWLEAQRSFPDPTLDWKNFHQAVENEQVKTAARGANPCEGYRPKWTLEGPTNVGGRVNTLVVHPQNEDVLLAGFSTGGIFKTTDGGNSWRPVFDDHLNLAIGILKFDPQNPDIIFCGTGDPNVPGNLFSGSGLFKSTDGGESWQLLGLADVGIITQICVHPQNSNIIFAASLGNPTIRNQHRGIYKTSDGGATWQQVLFVSNQAGASDLQMNPLNPNELYASFWDRIRTNTESIAFGPNAKFFKTSDGGANWQQLTNGLPTGVGSRTGLMMSPQNPQKIYAVFIDSTFEIASVFKTTDSGASWQPVSGLGTNVVGGFGWYFSKIRLNPTNDDEIYFLGVLLWRKMATASQFAVHGGMHADVHDFLITPSGKRFSGTDGGVYRNLPGQGVWTRLKIPTTQFYRVDFNHWNNQWYGGAQDNGVNKGTRQTVATWESVLPNDGFSMAFDQDNPDEMWGMTQNGKCWWSTDGGETFGQSGNALGTNDRVSWDAPLIASRHANNKKLYAATYRVYETDANGEPSWGITSPDLTDGIVFSPRFHTATCLSESPLVPGKLMAGTSDGNVWRREPSGNWFKINGTLPDRWLTSVKMSPTLANRLFTTHSGWRNNEQIPHIHRSDDNGATWQDISADLPNFPVNDLLILPNHKDSVLVAATDVGVFYSKNSGKKWSRLGTELPNVPVSELEINPNLKEIGAGTYARGLWTLKIDSLFAQTDQLFYQANGKITTPAGKGVAKVKIATATTDTAGLFYLPQLDACQSFELKPARNDSFLNGITTFDLLQISKHILGVQPFTQPIQYLAADANDSKNVTTNDIVTLRKLILGIDTVLAKRPSWDFLPKNFQFQHPADPFLDSVPKSYTLDFQNYKTLQPDFWTYKVGDLNNSAWLGFGQPADDRSDAEEFVIEVTPTSGLAEPSALIFSAENQNWAALQFTLEFDPRAAKFLEIKTLHPDFGFENFNLERLGEGLISVAATQIDLKNSQQPLFSLVLKNENLAAASNLKITSKLTAAAVFDDFGKMSRPVLRQRTSENLNSSRVVCRQNLLREEPLVFQFSNLKNQSLRLQVFDNQGKIVFSEKVLPSLEEFSFQILNEKLVGAGEFFWRATLASGGSFSGKLVKID